MKTTTKTNMRTINFITAIFLLSLILFVGCEVSTERTKSKQEIEIKNYYTVKFTNEYTIRNGAVYFKDQRGDSIIMSDFTIIK